MSSRSKALAIALAVLMLALAAYWYWSPYLVSRSMRAAALENDADTFNQYVDYPRLRESLKGQFSARMAEAMTAKGGGGTASAGSALGTMLGMALVDRMIDALVRPEMVMQAMSQGRLQDPSKKPAPASAPTSRSGGGTEWVSERKGFDRVIFYGRSRDSVPAPKDRGVGFVFDRSGFATWRLTEIRLPAG